MYGITGSKQEYLSVPYKAFRFSIESASTFDLEAELKIWISKVWACSQAFMQNFTRCPVNILRSKKFCTLCAFNKIGGCEFTTLFQYLYLKISKIPIYNLGGQLCQLLHYTMKFTPITVVWFPEKRRRKYISGVRNYGAEYHTCQAKPIDLDDTLKYQQCVWCGEMEMKSDRTRRTTNLLDAVFETFNPPINTLKVYSFQLNPTHGRECGERKKSNLMISRIKNAACWQR